MSASPGSLEGKYEVIAKIREGGMGAIYKVRHRLLNELRVIKVMRPEVAQSADQRKRFLREAQTATRLRHPNIVAFYDFFVDEEDTAYMVMEYIEGVNLRDMIRSCGAFPIPLAIDLSRQCLSAFDYLHRKGIVHRDVSPDNIMMSREDDGTVRAKLIDLGIAKIAQAKEELTAADEFIGKLRYSSPEQLTRSATSPQIDGRSDLFSMGIVIYEILTGVCPYGGESLHEIIGNRLENPPLSFEVSDPKGHLPAALKKAVLKALMRSPADRFQSASEFSEALEPFADAGGPERRAEVDRYVDEALSLVAAAAAGPGRGASDLGPTVKADLAPTHISGPVASARDEKFRNTIAKWSESPPPAVAPPGRSARPGEVDGITFTATSEVARHDESGRRRARAAYGAVAAALLLMALGVFIFRRDRSSEAGRVEGPASVSTPMPQAAMRSDRVAQLPTPARKPDAEPTAEVPKEPTLPPGSQAAAGSEKEGPKATSSRQTPAARVARLLPTKPAARGKDTALGAAEAPQRNAAVDAPAVAPGTKMHYCAQFDDTVYRQGVTREVPAGFEGMATKAPRPDSGLMKVGIALSKERPADDETFTIAVRFENGGDARVEVQRLDESSSRGGVRPVSGAAVPVSVSPGAIKELYRYPLALSGGEPYSKQFVVSDARGDSWKAGVRLVPCGD